MISDTLMKNAISKIWPWTILLFLAAILIFTDAPVSIPEIPEGKLAVVEFVIDGDTFDLDTGERVRLIGINAPERGEDFYNEAKVELRKLIENKDVELRKDVSDTDQYGRLLRYAYVSGILVNEELVRNGFARATPVDPDVAHARVFVEAEELSKLEGLGMWAYSKK